MTKVTVNKAAAASAPSPSAEIAARAIAASFEVPDARGRKLLLRKPGVLAQFRMIEAIGPEASRNIVYTNMVMPLICLAEIDGERVVPPTKKSEIEALILRLDEDGLAALTKGVEEHFGESSDPAADKAKLGN